MKLGYADREAMTGLTLIQHAGPGQAVIESQCTAIVRRTAHSCDVRPVLRAIGCPDSSGLCHA
jgi:hypothetical protein